MRSADENGVGGRQRTARARLPSVRVDDLFPFGDRRADLRRWRAEVAAWLRRERGLHRMHPEARGLSCAGHLDALGDRLRRGEHRALPRAGRRLTARVAAAMHPDLASGRRVDRVRCLASSAGVMTF